MEIDRYHDENFQEQVDECIEDFKGDIDTFNESVHSQHQSDIDALGVEHDEDVTALQEALRPLEQEHKQAVKDFNKAVRPLQEEYQRHARAFNAKTTETEAQRASLVAEFNERSEARGRRLNAIHDAVADDIEEGRPSLDAIDWPEPEFDEDDEPLYQSGRDYIEQVDILRKHQGKLLNGRRELNRLAKQRNAKIGILRLLGVIDRKEAQRLRDDPDLPLPEKPEDDE
jgi:hypothetical protein